MKSSIRTIRYNDLRLLIFRNVYEPAEDTFLAADNLIVNENDHILDMGTGCGILAILAAKKAKQAVAVDINPQAVRCARKNAEANKLADKVDIRRGDLFQPIRRNEKFNLIVFNAPYLPSTTMETQSWLGRAWAGGPTGRQTLDRFINEAPHHLRKKGRILLVQSCLADFDNTLRKFHSLGFEARVVAFKKVAFETIVLIEAKSFIPTVRKRTRRGEKSEVSRVAVDQASGAN